MDTSTLHDLVKAQMPEADIDVTTDGYYFNFRVVSEQFEGLNAVKRQQLVYAGLRDIIADGSLHAVNIKALTPSEASNKE